MRRYVIFNADDFGQTHGINRGIVRAHTQGVVTSASLMVRWPAAAEAAELAAAHPALSVGLHLDLGQWAFRDEWFIEYFVVDTDDARAVNEEVQRQLASFRDLMGADPTHLDGHQHVQRAGPARDALLAVAAELGVPVRLHSPVEYCGAFYGQSGKGDPYHEALSVEALATVISDLPEGWHEIGCHPGMDDDAPAGYRVERSLETEVLSDPATRVALVDAGVELRSFHDWR